MSIYLTQLGSDNFQRANESPLSQGGKWVKNTANDPALQVVNGVCETTAGGPNNYNEGAVYSGVALPADQYVAITLGTFSLTDNVSGGNSYFGPCIRFTEGGLHFEHEPCYMLWLTPAYTTLGGLWQITWGAYNNVAQGYGLTVSPGDIITLAAIGTTLYLYQNTTLVWSGTDTNYSSGGAALVLQNTETNNANYTVSNWSVGSASLTETSGSFTPGSSPSSGSTLPFLGSVTVVDGIPAGENDVFQGTVKVVASVPNGENNPYLGHVNVLSAAPSGRWNPSLGQVVVLSSRPNNTAPDIWFGSVVES